MAGWRAVCPSKTHRFERQVDRYVSEHGRLVAVVSCPHCGKRLVIAGEA